MVSSAIELMMPNLSPPAPIPCEICTYPSHGFHFKVVSCRACAAFFRRSLLSGLKYICKGGDESCHIDKSVRYFCKFCRFQKCVNSGMSAEKIQQNRDPISSTIPGTSSDFLPPLIEESVKKSMFDGPLYDFDSFMTEIRRIFSQKKMHPPDTVPLSPLKELERGLKFIRRNQKRRYLEIAEEIIFEKITITRLNLIKTCATWLMFSSFFRDLKEKEKFLILKTTWHVWARLELLTISVEIFGEKVVTDRIVFISENVAAYLIEIFRNNLANLDPKEAEDVDRELQPLFTAIFDDVARKLVKFDGKLVEIGYMLWQMVWCVAGRILTGGSLEAGEKYTDQLADDLDAYFRNEIQMEKYAWRVMKMMSVVRTLQKTYIDIHRVIDHANRFREFYVVK